MIFLKNNINKESKGLIVIKKMKISIFQIYHLLILKTIYFIFYEMIKNYEIRKNEFFSVINHTKINNIKYC